MKGIQVTEGPVVSPITGVATNVSGIMANFKSGPVNEAVLVGNMSQFEAVFGDEPAPGTTGYHSVNAFFASAGNAPLWVNRIASATAAKSLLTIQDRQTPTPADTLKIEWKYPGADGDNGAIVIADDNILSTIPAVNIDASATSAQLVSIGGLEVGSWVEFDNGTNQEQVQITSIVTATKTINWTGGLSNAYTTANGSVVSLEFSIAVYYKNNLLKTYSGLSMVDAVSFHVEKAINQSSTAKIAVTDMKSSDAGLTDLPAVTAKTSLASGADGLDDVVGADYEGSASLKTGVHAFDAVPSLFRICCPNPNLTDADAAAAYDSIVQKMIDYSTDAVRPLEAYQDVPLDKTEAEQVTWQAKFESRHLSLWSPWGVVYTSVGNVYVPGSSGAMGAVVRKDFVRTIGVAKSVGNEPVGLFIGVEKGYTAAQSNTLNDAGICTIENKNGGIRTWGARSQSVEGQWLFVEDSEYFNFFARSIITSLQSMAFEPINLATSKGMARALTSFCRSEFNKGAITEYLIDVEEPDESDSDGILDASVAYRRADTAETIRVKLTASKSSLTVAAA